MADAVVVSTARTAIGTAFRGTLVDVDADMSITVGWNAAVEADVTREEMDAWALRSHQRALAGIDNGSFVDEIVPIDVVRRDGTRATFAVDEHPRRDTSMEKLGSLKPLHPEIEGFSITAGNACGANDGAAAMVVADRELAEANGLEPLAVIRAWASVGVPPERTGLAPTIAIPKALDRAGVPVADGTRPSWRRRSRRSACWS